MASMKRILALVLLAALAVLQAPAHAQPRVYDQAELDALLAPVALYPDSVLSQVLVAATYPQDVREAAAWSRANPHLQGDDAVRAAEPMLWDPSLKALLAFPDLLARMDESPQWTADLGTAFLTQEPQVMDTIQGLRRRAQASGALQSSEHQQIVQQGQIVIVQPVQPQVVYVRYYDPYIVYGPWWWHSYRPVVWRPWHPRPAVFVSAHFFSGSVDWHRRHVTRVHRAAPRQVHIQNHVPRAQIARPIAQGAQIRPQAGHQSQNARPRIQGSSIRQPVTDRNPIPQAQSARPIVQSATPIVQSARPVVQGARLHPQVQQREQRSEQRREHRSEGRQQPRQENRRNGRG